MRHHPIPAPSYNRIIRNKLAELQSIIGARLQPRRVSHLKPKLEATEMITGSISLDTRCIVLYPSCFRYAESQVPL